MLTWPARPGALPRAIAQLAVLALAVALLGGCGDGGAKQFVGDVDDPDPIVQVLPTATISSVTLNGELVEICYSLVDPNADLISILAEYSTDGGATYRSATDAGVPPSEGTTDLTSSAAGIVHCFVWSPALDGVGVAAPTTAVFRITPRDATGVGTLDVSDPFTVDNPSVVVDLGTTTALFGSLDNQLPVVLTTNGTSPTSVTVMVTFDELLLVPSAVPVVLGSAATAVGALVSGVNPSLPGRLTFTISGPLPIGDGTLALLQFDSLLPAVISPTSTPVTCQSVEAVDTAHAPLAAVCGLSGEIFLNPNLAPSCAITYPTAGLVFTPQSVPPFLGDLQIDYVLSDPEGDLISIDVAYSTDGVTFFPATETPGPPSEGTIDLISAPAPGVAHTFVWDAFGDIPSLTAAAETVYVQITPTDVAPASPCRSEGFVLDLTNKAPVCTITSTAGASGDITITFDVTDNESDPVDIRFEYDAPAGTGFAQATASGASPLPSPSLGQATPITGGTFVWNSPADTGTVTVQVNFRIVVNDGFNPDQTCSSGVFSVDNSVRVFNSLVVLGPGSPLGMGPNVVTGGFTPGDPCTTVDGTGAGLFNFAFSLGGPNVGELTDTIELASGGNPLIFEADGLSLQLVVQGNFSGLGAPEADITAATTADGDTTYAVVAGPGGPFTTVSTDGLVTSQLVVAPGANGMSGCDTIEVTFTPNGMGTSGGSDGTPMTVPFAACIDYWGFDQFSREDGLLLLDPDWDATMPGTPSGPPMPGAGGQIVVMYVGMAPAGSDPSAFDMIVTYDPLVMSPDTGFGVNGAAVCSSPPYGGAPWTPTSNPTFGPDQWLVNGFRVGAASVPAGPLAAYTDSVLAMSWNLDAAGDAFLLTTQNEWADSTATTFPGRTFPFDTPGCSSWFTIP